jgi:hypothetical protein
MNTYPELLTANPDYQKLEKLLKSGNWKQGKKWLNYKDINCDLTAPKGQLPSRAWGCMVAWWWVVDWQEAILARIYLLSHPGL